MNKTSLYQWAEADAICSKAVKEILAYKQMINDARDLKAVVNDGMPRGTSVGNPTESRALTAIKLEEEYSAHVEFLTAQVISTLESKRIIDSILSGFPPIYTNLAIKRYREGKKWTRIADEIYVSEATARRMNSALVDKVERY